MNWLHRINVLLEALMMRSFCGELVLDDFALSESIGFLLALCTHCKMISMIFCQYLGS